MELLIIKAVKMHRLLYDTQHEDYFRSKIRQKTWDLIAQDLNMKSGDEVKNQFERIKRNYSRYLQKEDNTKKKCEYAEEMKFFNDYMVNDRENVRKEVPEDDTLSDFFIEMYQETKELSPYLQDHVKQEIFNVISEAKAVEAIGSSSLQQNVQKTDTESNGATLEEYINFNPYDSNNLNEENEGRESPPPALIEYINNFIP